jgi:hypothetical protein
MAHTVTKSDKGTWRCSAVMDSGMFVHLEKKFWKRSIWYWVRRVVVRRQTQKFRCQKQTGFWSNE